MKWFITATAFHHQPALWLQWPFSVLKRTVHAESHSCYKSFHFLHTDMLINDPHCYKHT